VSPQDRIPGARALRALYAQGKTTVPEVAERVWKLSDQGQHKEAWIYRVPREDLLADARRLQALTVAFPDARERFPLLGVPFAVKDNIDVAGVPTTAACPGYSRVPEASAPAVQKLLDAGALFVGKTNMDQFATGLVGTRSPYGACRNPFNPDYISGGSSSGSALAVSVGMVAFALGTDTAGSGRVPAAFTNIAGLKPTRGAVSTRGVVPACPSLDCVTVFTPRAADAFDILRVIEDFDFDDPYSRTRPARKVPELVDGPLRFRFGVPLAGQLDFAGDSAYAALYEQGRAALASIGGIEVPVDISPLLRAAQMLYQGPWLAERAEAIGRFGNEHPEDLMPLLREILAPAASIPATEVFRGLHEMQALRRLAEPLWEVMDLLYLPTTPTIFTQAQIAEEPLARNAILGRFTNFVNLMDLCAVSLPAGFRPDGLPFGITLIAPAFCESVLEPVARAWEAKHE
jgi:allophanate hydrolase